MELAVVSGKGGTGKSSVTAAFATAGERIVVADCDVDAANLYLLFNPNMTQNRFTSEAIQLWWTMLYARYAEYVRVIAGLMLLPRWMAKS